MSRDLSRDVKSVKKKSPNFFCKKCDYMALQKSHYDKHLSSKKHQKNCQKVLKNCQKVLKKSVKRVVNFECMVCEKKYSTRQGLWYHRNKNTKCTSNKMSTGGKSVKKKKIMVSEKMDENDETNSELEILKNEILELKQLKEEKGDNDNELMKTLIEVIKTNQEQNNHVLMEIAKNANTINYNNCGNKNLTVNVYLEEHCKNAMNLTDFVQNLTVSIEDLLYTKEHGYIKGISNLLTKQLNDLNPTERPIHCSDKKRLQFYIKDEGKWEKDTSKIDKSILDVQHAQIKKMYDWELVNPGWKENSKLVDEWQQIVHGITGSGIDFKKSKKVIKRDLSTKIDIKEQIKK